MSNTSSNISCTLQDLLKSVTNLKIEQLCSLILETKGTDFYTEALKVWHLSTVSPEIFVLEIDCLFAEYPL